MQSTEDTEASAINTIIMVLVFKFGNVIVTASLLTTQASKKYFCANSLKEACLVFSVTCIFK